MDDASTNKAHRLLRDWKDIGERGGAMPRGKAFDELPGHQTLRASLEWGYRLLTPSALALYRCLGVFGWPFMLDDVCAVAPTRR